MGIFDFLKPKGSSLESIFTGGSIKRKIESLNREGQHALLTKLGINPYDYKHDNMEPSNISLSEEVAGAIRISDLQSKEDDSEFDYISLTDNSNGTKALYLAQTNREERAIKVLVDKYFAEFGESDIVGAEFSRYDLMQINEYPSGALREWNLKNFTVIVGYNYASDLLSNYVIVEEKY
jgi:hypothetical protein